MSEVKKAPDGLDGFIALCDDHKDEMLLETGRKLYTEKDFSCVYCLDYEKKSGCKYKVCQYTPEKVYCGCASLASVWRYLAFEIDHERLIRRVNHYIRICKRKKSNPTVFYDTEHQSVFNNCYLKLNHENSKLLAAVYLLSADERLWKSAWSQINMNDISFGKIKPKVLSSDTYTLFCAAKDLYLGSEHFSFSDLADPAVVDITRFCLVLNALGIVRFGYNYINIKKF